MTARTHDAFAFASLVTVAAYFPPESITIMTFFAAIVGNIIGALVPDMDQESNRLWDLIPLGDNLSKIFRRVFYKHRTITHSILGVYLIYNLLGFVLPKLFNPNFINPNIVFASMMIGYISHLLADSLTKEGLPLFFPLGIEIGVPPIKAFRITTGKWVEKLIVFPAVGVYLVWFILQHKESLINILSSIH